MLGNHHDYPGDKPARPEDLAETVSLVEGEGRKILADHISVDTNRLAEQFVRALHRPIKRIFRTWGLGLPHARVRGMQQRRYRSR
jgi:hypothetical protein